MADPVTKRKSPLGCIATFIGAVIGFMVVAWLTSPTPPNWQRYNFDALSIEAPNPFGIGPDVLSKLDQVSRSQLVSLETHLSSSTPSFQVLVAKWAFTDEAKIDINEMAIGAATNSANAFCSGVPVFANYVDQISDAQVRRTEFDGSKDGVSVHIYATYIQDGQTVYQISVIWTGDKLKSDGKRCVSSLRYKHNTK